MMPQREIGESIHEQTGATYGRYEGDQTYTQQSYEPSFEHSLGDRPGEKVYPVLPSNKNLFRLIIFFSAMVMILVCALLFIFFMGGTGGWIGFIVAAGVIFLISVVTIEKIQ
jgi:uncharacterized membrane protein